MNKITQHLSQPLPFISQWKTVLFPALWVFLLTIILKPLGFEYSSNKLWIIISFTGLTIISCSIVVYTFPLLFKKYFAPQNFTNGKFYLGSLSIIFIASILCCIVSYYICISENTEMNHSTPVRFILWFFFVVFVAILPIIIIYGSLRNRRLKMVQEKLKETYENEILQSENTKDIVVVAKTSKYPLKLLVAELLYIEAQGNNVTVYYLRNANILQKQFRDTLTKIMDELKDYSQIIRCHRSFVVNIDNVNIELTQNIQSNKLILDSENIEIPVSRSYLKEVREKLFADF